MFPESSGTLGPYVDFAVEEIEVIVNYFKEPAPNSDPNPRWF